MTRKIPVLVTGVGGGGLGEQILKALRLSTLSYEIIGTDLSPTSKGFMEVDHPYVLPPASHSDFMSSVLTICEKHQVQAIFAGSETELKIMSQRRGEILKKGIFLPINPEYVIHLCTDKSKIMQELQERGFSVPATFVVRSVSDLDRINIFPAVLKPSVGSGASANVLIAQTKNELLMLGTYLSSLYSEFIVQEYIGTVDSEFTVGVLISMDGELLNSIALRRIILSGLSNRVRVSNRTDNKKFGPLLAISSGISQGEIGAFPDITKPCEEIAMTLGCRSSVNLQCRYADGKVYVFEINPRFSGTTSLRAMMGYNEPDLLIRKHLLGEKITPRFSYRTGYILRGLHEQIVDPSSIPAARDLL